MLLVISCTQIISDFWIFKQNDLRMNSHNSRVRLIQGSLLCSAKEQKISIEDKIGNIRSASSWKVLAKYENVTDCDIPGNF